MNIEIRNGKTLIDGNQWFTQALQISNGVLRLGTRDEAELTIDADQLLVLPGIIDLHGDAFERQLMPRPGVHFGHESALLETDNQMIANGITMAYHGLTYSWEPGLRGAEAARVFVQTLHQMRNQLRVDTRLHLRHETYNLDAEQEVIDWLRAEKVDLLAFNDHVAHIETHLEKPEKLSVYAGRTGLTPTEFTELHQATKSRKNEVPDSVARIAGVARQMAVPMASHDDETPDMRAGYHGLGCRICEFPVDLQTAEYAAEHGDPIILGAPNVLRGGSHCGRLSAVEAIRAGACTVLTSDYYYPSLILAVFKLVNDKVMPLAEAWNLVSKNAALAVGCSDRGVIAEGKRGDLLIVDVSNPNLPVVKAAFVAGELQYTHNLGERLEGQRACAVTD